MTGEAVQGRGQGGAEHGGDRWELPAACAV